LRWTIALRDRIRLKAGLQFHIVSAGPVSVRDLGNGRKQFREFNFANSTKIEELIWSHSYADAVCTLLPASSQIVLADQQYRSCRDEETSRLGQHHDIRLVCPFYCAG
jgi:hypothetical protein